MVKKKFPWCKPWFDIRRVIRYCSCFHEIFRNPQNTIISHYFVIISENYSSLVGFVSDTDSDTRFACTCKNVRLFYSRVYYITRCACLRLPALFSPNNDTHRGHEMRWYIIQAVLSDMSFGVSFTTDK